MKLRKLQSPRPLIFFCSFETFTKEPYPLTRWWERIKYRTWRIFENSFLCKSINQVHSFCEQSHSCCKQRAHALTIFCDRTLSTCLNFVLAFLLQTVLLNLKIYKLQNYCKTILKPRTSINHVSHYLNPCFLINRFLLFPKLSDDLWNI